jgi:hypothetical protein
VKDRPELLKLGTEDGGWGIESVLAGLHASTSEDDWKVFMGEHGTRKLGDFNAINRETYEVNGKTYRVSLYDFREEMCMLK